jgi:hypothetical protein
MKIRWSGLLSAATLIMAPVTATAQTPGPAALPWEISPEIAYIYGSDGKTLSYRLGTNNAKDLLKGAKKVPKGTLFFLGANGQLYMRSGPYLEDDGSFKFGSGS